MKLAVSSLLVLVLLPCPAPAQGEAAFPFLLISPSAVSNGMGETSVGLHRDDPLAAMANPAHLGITSRTGQFAAGYDYADWLPGFRSSDINVRNFGFTAGVNLKDRIGIAPEVSLGIGYFRNKLNLGTMYETDPGGPEPIDSFQVYESADNYSIGVGLRTWVDIAAGYTTKRIRSNIAFDSAGRQITVNVPAYDFGLYFAVPVVDIVRRVGDAAVMLPLDLSPFVNLTFGLAKNNMGDRMVTLFGGQPDPLPRHARMGAGVEVGAAFTRNDVTVRPFVVSLSRESNDILVRRFPAPMDPQGIPIGDPPPPEYRSGFGDIRFLDDIVLGKGNGEVVIKTGWQITLYDLFAFRGGRFYEAPNRGGRNFTTTGVTVMFGGIPRIMNILGYRIGPDGLVGTIINHLDVRYTTSRLDTAEPNHPLDKTEFSSWTLVLGSWK